MKLKTDDRSQPVGRRRAASAAVRRGLVAAVVATSSVAAMSPVASVSAETAPRPEQRPPDPRTAVILDSRRVVAPADATAARPNRARRSERQHQVAVPPPPPVVPAPVTPPAPTPPAPTRVAVAPPLPSGAVALIRVGSIGLDMPIYPGGQSTIDRGLVTWFDGRSWGWPAPSAPGEPGAFWVAAHHSTAGSPFARVDEIRMGERVEIVTDDGSVFTFEIVASYIGDDTPPDDVILGKDRNAPTLTLQTSQPNNTRLVLNGVLV